MTVGILGMAFKGESDDNRSSLSYKLKRVLNVRARRGVDHRSVRAGGRQPLARWTRCWSSPTSS